MDKYKEFESISMNELNSFFSFGAIELLQKMNVNNLSQLFQLSDKGILDSNFPIRFYNHIFRGIKLLRCKYLDEDPLIDIKKKNIDSNCEYLGLTVRSYTCLSRYFRYVSDNSNINLFDFIREPNSFVKLHKIRNMGEKSAKEVYERAMIVIDYYDRHKEDNKVVVNESNEKETLEYLYVELKRLREENARIDKEIGVILGKIEEKTLKDSKGGIKK